MHGKSSEGKAKYTYTDIYNDYSDENTKLIY